MTVAVNSTRKAVEVSWDTEGGAATPSPPDEFPSHPISGGEPTHPIYLPPYVDIGFPADQPYPDQGLPGNQPYPDQGLPGDQPRPDQSLPEDQPRPDQSLPGDQPKPDQSLPTPQPPVDPDYDIPEDLNDLPEAVKQKVVDFLTGNLPSYGQTRPTPVSAEQASKAVQVF